MSSPAVLSDHRPERANLAFSSEIDRFVLVSVPTLFALADTLSDNPVLHVLWAVPLALLCLKNFRVAILANTLNSGLQALVADQKLYLFCVGLMGLSLVRAFLTGSMTFTRVLGQSAFFSLTILAIMSRQYFRSDLKTRLTRRDVLLCLGLFSAVNFALLALGVQSAALGGNVRSMVGSGDLSAIFQSIFNVDISALNFPLGRGYNAIGSVFGALIAAAFPFAISNKQTPFIWSLAIFGVVSGTIACISVDAKGAIACGLLFGLAVSISPKILLQFAPLAVIALPVVPFVVFILVEVFGLPAVLNMLGIKESFIAGLDQRAIIWGGILAFLRHFSPMHLIGYGANGQVASGVVYTYNALILDIDPQYMTAHNYWLQTVLDMGYFGVVVLWMQYLSVFIRLTSQLHDKNGDDAATRSTMALFLYFLALGLTEALPLLYSPEMLFVWSLAILQMKSGPRRWRISFNSQTT